MESWLVLTVSAAYIAVLFAIAWAGDRRGSDAPIAPPNTRRAALFYALTLTVYNTTWSFYGSVGRAAASGFDFLPIYLGPVLLLLFGGAVFAKVIAIAKAQNLTSIADFIAARYGKSQTLAALVTVTALFGLLPYIGLQLKALAASYDVLTGVAQAAGTPPLRDTGLFVTAAMAAFSILFGVRHIHASEHHRGLMLAIGFEAVVKLAAFVAVACTIVYGMAGGIGELWGRAAADPALAPLLVPDFSHPTWVTNTLISVFAFLCLPQMFHVAVVENYERRHVRSAAWLYPGYLAVLSIFMVPIAIVGLTAPGGAAVDPDTYMITLPLAAGYDGIGLLAFIGGLSAGTGMVIVASVALSTMLCNDLVMPVLLRASAVRQERDLSGLLLTVRRIAIAVILGLAYLTYRVVGDSYALTTIGLMSFVAVAQFGPSFFGGLYWRGANRAGALWGLAAGFAVWAYTLLLPAIAQISTAEPALLAEGPFGIAWLRPQALFGLDGLDAISHATLWSLGANLAVFAALSLLARPQGLEVEQATAFVTARGVEGEPPRAWRALTTLADLRALAVRYIGEERGNQAIDAYLHLRGLACANPAEERGRLADVQSVRFTEHLLAGAIGAASARVVMASSLQGKMLSRGAAMAMLDEASEAIRHNRELLQATLESVSQGICVCDEQFRIATWNRRFLELLDLPPDRVRVGTPMVDIVRFIAARGEYSGSDLGLLLLNRAPSVAQWPYVYERRRPDGTVIEVCSTPMPGGGFVSTYTDVTDRHAAAAALREANEGLEQRVRERTLALEQAKAEAERANSSKTRFLAGASHDLLQPLNAARLFSAALCERMEAPAAALDEAARTEERGLAHNAAASLRSVEKLLGGLLDISSLDAGAVRPEPQRFAIQPLLDRLSVEFAALAAQAGLHLTRVGSDAVVHSDPHLLRRILQNFLANAIRYTPRGRILIGCRRRGGRLHIEVHDTGPGIPADRLGEIFQEFRRLHASDGDREKGLGLGLAIVERIARMLGHDIAVRSQPGRGSVFAVAVPLAESQARAPVPPVPVVPRLAPQLDGLLVLCIDNERSILAGMESLLRGWSCRVVAAADEAEAAAGLAGRVPDIAIVDYHLDQGRSGTEALERLARAWPHRVPSLLLSADRSEAVREDARRLGLQVLYKPVKPAALRRFLTGAALQRPAGLGDEQTP